MPHHGTQRCSNETSYGTLSSCSQQLPHRIDYIRQARLAVRRCQGTVGKRWYGGMRERMGFRPKRIGPTFWSGLIRSSSFTSASRNLHVSSKERGSYPSLGPRPCHRFLRPLPALWSYLHAAGIPCRLCPQRIKLAFNLQHVSCDHLGAKRCHPSTSHIYMFYIKGVAL